MREILDSIGRWRRDELPFALATVVRTWGSAPRQAGASLAVAAGGEVVGSVSGGCVEGAVYELAEEVLRTDKPVLATYGVSDDDALAVGLTCGGILDVYVQPVGERHFPHLSEVLSAVEAHRPVAVASVIAGPDGPGGNLVVSPEAVRGTLGDSSLDDGVVEHVRGMLAAGATGVFHCGPLGEQRRDDLTIFVQSFVAPPRMLVFGAIDFAGAVARMGKFLGYHVTVCDARPVFATAKRFPEADEVIVDWPHRFLDKVEVDERTVICVLTHDPKFDVPLLQLALETPARYVGAMGSWRTHRERLQRLTEVGVDAQALARLSSPIGMDLGARTAEETAVAIAAEIIALQWGGTGRRLTDSGLEIHRQIHAPSGPNAGKGAQR